MLGVWAGNIGLAKDVPAGKERNFQAPAGCRTRCRLEKIITCDEGHLTEGAMGGEGTPTGPAKDSEKSLRCHSLEGLIAYELLVWCDADNQNFWQILRAKAQQRTLLVAYK